LLEHCLHHFNQSASEIDLTCGKGTWRGSCRQVPVVQKTPGPDDIAETSKIGRVLAISQVKEGKRVI
jgi:hypothetical protein